MGKWNYRKAEMDTESGNGHGKRKWTRKAGTETTSGKLLMEQITHTSHIATHKSTYIMGKITSPNALSK